MWVGGAGTTSGPVFVSGFASSAAGACLALPTGQAKQHRAKFVPAPWACVNAGTCGQTRGDRRARCGLLPFEGHVSRSEHVGVPASQDRNHARQRQIAFPTASPDCLLERLCNLQRPAQHVSVTVDLPALLPRDGVSHWQVLGAARCAGQCQVAGARVQLGTWVAPWPLGGPTTCSCK